MCAIKIIFLWILGCSAVINLVYCFYLVPKLKRQRDFFRKHFDKYSNYAEILREWNRL